MLLNRHKYRYRDDENIEVDGLYRKLSDPRVGKASSAWGGPWVRIAIIEYKDAGDSIV